MEPANFLGIQNHIVTPDDLSSSPVVALKVLPDRSAADSRCTEDRSFFPGRPFIFSVIVHSTIFLVLFWGVYQPNRRPLKEVNYWAVNLITEWNAAPQGIKKGNIEGASLAVPRHPEKSKTEAQLPPDKGGPVTEEAGPETKLVSQGEDPSPQTMEITPPPSPPAPGPQENAWKVMKDVADQKIQMGQYVFTMRMPDRLAGMKMVYFQKNVKSYLENILRASLSAEILGTLQGQTVSIQLSYPGEANSPQIDIGEDSDPNLAQVLGEKMDWRTVTPPARYALPNKAMRIRVAVNELGKISVGVELL